MIRPDTLTTTGLESGTDSMKAVRLHVRGGPENIVYETAPKPTLKKGDALVKIVASGITYDELGWVPTFLDEEGEERIPTIPGHEFSGIVESVPAGIDNLKEGDEVYGLTSFYRNGTAAQYAAVYANTLAAKPKTIGHIEAASLPLSALTAFQALFTHGNLIAHKRVLIHGAAGGVGSLAVQLARWTGAYVIGTASASNLSFIRELGVDQAIDYNNKDFERQVSDVDIVLDTVGGETQDRSWQVIKKGGVLVTIAGPYSHDLARRYDVRGKFFVVEPDAIGLRVIGSLIDRGIMQPVIHKVFPLAQTREAFEHGARRHNRGKIVLTVD